jgi:dTMP kinase
MRGRFITFEGLDGSGKTTQIEMAAARLRRQGRAVTIAQEPGGTAAGAAIRAILLGSQTTGLDPRAEVLLYFASRAQNVSEVILSALRAGHVVLCDRFTDSSRAYQGSGRKLGSRAIDNLDRVACQGLRPDLTILIDVGVDRAAGRRTTADRIEKEDAAFFRRVRREYLAIARREPRRVKMVDGNRSVEEIHEDVWGLIVSSVMRRR